MASFKTQQAYLIPCTPVVLNIGLSTTAAERNDPARKANRIRSALSQFMSLTHWRVDYPDVGEDTLVVHGRFTGAVLEHTHLWDLLLQLGENCCAIYYPSLSEGYIYGPDTSGYEPFNINLFKD